MAGACTRTVMGRSKRPRAYLGASPERWFVTVGMRVDSKERYDTNVSPKLSTGEFLLPYRAAGLSSLKVFGNVGRGVKSPTFSERFGGSASPTPLRTSESNSRPRPISASKRPSPIRPSGRRRHSSATSSPTRFLAASVPPAIASPSSSTSMARRPAAWNSIWPWWGRCTG